MPSSSLPRIFFAAIIPFSLVASSSQSLLGDKAALLSFKSRLTGDPAGSSLSSWNKSTSPCRWRGVSCDKPGGRVIGLDLQSMGLAGPISSDLGNLSSLRLLYLQNNRLTGLLEGIGNLRRLVFLNVSSNYAWGTIHPDITQCSELRVLDVSQNGISGTIPSDIGRISKLQVLSLGHNQLTGEIPPSIANLSYLDTLDLGTNNLGGEIPHDLGRLRALKRFEVSMNNLVGVVPPSLYNISSLVHFGLESNRLRGELPSDLGTMLPNLRAFRCSFNQFAGPVPRSLFNLTGISDIRMSSCLFVGALPPGALSNLPELVTFEMGFNRISASATDVITSLTNSTKLESLAIDEIFLEGAIPESVGNLSTRLTKLLMGGGMLRGSLPSSIGRLSNMGLLNISYNGISGEIPSEIGHLRELQVLDLSWNKFSGKVPSSIGDLPKMSELLLFRNELVGGIPPTFGNWEQLLCFDVSQNHLTGSIPKGLFRSTSISRFDLSSNSLTGPVPEEIGRLVHAYNISMSHNHLSGNIPHSIGNCRSLQYLAISDNLLSGAIPDSIGRLSGLQSLDLSANQLSGHVPQDLPSALQYLNLSFNNLEGVLPSKGIFRNMSSVHLQGNDKLHLSIQGRKGKHLSVLEITSLASGCALALALLAFFAHHRQSKGSTISPAPATGLSTAMANVRCPFVSYEELLRATENFNSMNLIGSGAFGNVYRATLLDGVECAIKVLDLGGNRGAVKSFVAECEALRNVRHRNLVKLITSCSSAYIAQNNFYALVYEFMENGSLDDWLRGRRKRKDGSSLDIMDRVDIIIDIAGAMDYLHNGCKVPVVHGDLKPGNVLLDKEMTAKIGDFGLAKFLVEKDGERHASTTLGIGSIGYIPPEYGLGGARSTRGDAYSFGITVLEVFTGKSPTDSDFKGQQTLQRWVRSAFPHRLMEIVDPVLLQMNEVCYQDRLISPIYQNECLSSVIKVGLSCVTERADERISMRDALLKMKEIREALTVTES